MEFINIMTEGNPAYDRRKSFRTSGGPTLKISIKKYRGFIIDADNTLFDFDRAQRDALFESLKLLKYRDFSDETNNLFESINKTLWEKLEKGQIDRESLKVERFRLLLDKLQTEGDPEKLAQLYLKHLGHKDYLLPHAIEVLEYLYRRALLVLLTNGITRVQQERITRSGIEIFFQDIIISEEIGLTKPDPAIFLLAARRINLPPSALLCVGDSPSSDIRGGYNAGMDTCWYRSTSADYPYQEPEPDYIIDDLRELIKFAPDLC